MCDFTESAMRDDCRKSKACIALMSYHVFDFKESAMRDDCCMNIACIALMSFAFAGLVVRRTRGTSLSFFNYRDTLKLTPSCLLGPTSAL